MKKDNNQYKLYRIKTDNLVEHFKFLFNVEEIKNTISKNRFDHIKEALNTKGLSYNNILELTYLIEHIALFYDGLTTDFYGTIRIPKNIHKLPDKILDETHEDAMYIDDDYSIYEVTEEDKNTYLDEYFQNHKDFIETQKRVRDAQIEFIKKGKRDPNAAISNYDKLQIYEHPYLIEKSKLCNILSSIDIVKTTDRIKIDRGGLNHSNIPNFQLTSEIYRLIKENISLSESEKLRLEQYEQFRKDNPKNSIPSKVFIRNLCKSLFNYITNCTSVKQHNKKPNQIPSRQQHLLIGKILVLMGFLPDFKNYEFQEKNGEYIPNMMEYNNYLIERIRNYFK